MSDDGEFPRCMSDTPLPPLPPPDAATLKLVDLMLDKQPIDPAFLPSPEAAAARAARDAWQSANDWPALARYRDANRTVRNPDMVMIGDSLTEIWGHAMPELFGDAIANRGISGQTSPQILLRFMADVVDLKPRRVHILCGTNDIAGNTGPTVAEDYQRNIRAMVDIAGANGIDVLLASIPPAGAIFWQPEARPLEWIPRLNDWLRAFAAKRGPRYVDYHAALTDGDGCLQDAFSADGVHVTRTAYRLMHDVLERDADHCADRLLAGSPAPAG